VSRDRWSHVPYRMEDGSGDAEVIGSFERSLRKGASTPVRIGQLVVGTVALGLLAWLIWSMTEAALHSGDRERRITACVTGMEHSDGSRVKACEGLDEDGKREASYRYLRRIGWL